MTRKGPDNKVGFLVIVLAFASCSGKPASESAYQKYERFTNIQASLQALQRTFTGGCLRREGYDQLPPQTQKSVLNVSSTEFPSEVFLTYTDQDLLAIHPTPVSSKSSALLAAASTSRTVDGVFFERGCSEWAEAKVAKLYPFVADIEATNKELESRSEKEETKALAKLGSDWQDCLKGEASKLARSKGYRSPSELNMTLGYEALRIVSDRSVDLTRTRQQLSERVEYEKIVMTEGRRCAEETDYFTEFDGLRSSTIAKVLSSDKAERILALDPSQITIPRSG